MATSKRKSKKPATAKQTPREKVIEQVYQTTQITLERSGQTVEVQELPYGRYNDFTKLLAKYASDIPRLLGVAADKVESAGEGKIIVAMIDAFTANEDAMLNLAGWQCTALTRSEIGKLPTGDKLQLLEACVDAINLKDIQRFFRVMTKTAQMCAGISPETGSSPT